MCNARATPITDPIVTHVCDIGLGNGGSTSVSHNNYFYYCSHLKPSYHPNYVQSNRDLTRLPIRYQKSWPTVREGCLERTQLKREKKGEGVAPALHTTGVARAFHTTIFFEFLFNLLVNFIPIVWINILLILTNWPGGLTDIFRLIGPKIARKLRVKRDFRPILPLKWPQNGLNWRKANALQEFS